MQIYQIPGCRAYEAQNSVLSELVCIFLYFNIIPFFHNNNNKNNFFLCHFGPHQINLQILIPTRPCSNLSKNIFFFILDGKEQKVYFSLKSQDNV